jgi:hypothetical protein
LIVPDHWAEARLEHRERGKSFVVRRFGWSMASAEDAQAMAQQRAQEALQQLRLGQVLPRRERKRAYLGSEGVPIREEVLERHGEEAITRNLYGAQCLNSPAALFVDIDFPEVRPWPWGFLAFALWGVPAAAIGWQQRSLLLTGLLWLAAALLAPWLARTLHRLAVAVRGGAQAMSLARVQRFVTQHPGWGLRVYRTPAGLRLLATHRPFSPTEPDVQALFDAVAADPAYVRLCLHQQCFRARLTAKPWRMGMTTRPRPRPGLWPVAAERRAERQAWMAEYDRRASAFASCHYLQTLGAAAVHPRLAPVVALHDARSRALDLRQPCA